VHANSATDALSRLETLASMSELELPVDVIRDQINGAVDIIVQLSRFPDGSRKVVEIAAVTSRRREEYHIEHIAQFLADPVVHGQPATGRFVARPLPHLLRDRLVAGGESVPAAYLDGEEA